MGKYEELTIFLGNAKKFLSFYCGEIWPGHSFKIQPSTYDHVQGELQTSEDTLSFPIVLLFKLDDKGGWDKHAAILHPCS